MYKDLNNYLYYRNKRKLLSMGGMQSSWLYHRILVLRVRGGGGSVFRKSVGKDNSTCLTLFSKKMSTAVTLPAVVLLVLATLFFPTALLFLLVIGSKPRTDLALPQNSMSWKLSYELSRNHMLVSHDFFGGAFYPRPPPSPLPPLPPQPKYSDLWGNAARWECQIV